MNDAWLGLAWCSDLVLLGLRPGLLAVFIS